MGLLNFEEQLTFYGQYHNNPWLARFNLVCNIFRNRVVHILFVPMLFWSFMVFVANLPVLIIFEQIPFNFSFAFTFLYIFYYILLEPVAGVLFDFEIFIYVCRLYMHRFFLPLHIPPMFLP